MKPKRSVDLTTGPILKQLVLFALPILASNLLQHLYNAADKAVVGNFAENGKIALAAVGSTAFATSLIVNMFIGLSVGANILCSNLRGSRQHAELRRCMHNCILLAACAGVGVALLGILISRPLLEAMNCPGDLIDQACLYMRIIFCGTPFSLVYNFASAIIRSHGDTRRPMLILSGSGLVNVALNLIFVVVFHLDVAGVAIATVVSQMLSCLRALKILFDPKDEFKLKFSELKFHGHTVKSILQVGIPCGINSSVFSISNVTVQAALNTFSSTAVAGGVAATSVSNFPHQIIGAFYSATISFSGQCYGARKYQRIRKLMHTAMAACISLIALAAILLTLFPNVLLGIYNRDPEVLAYGRIKLFIISWSYVIYSVSEVFLACLRGMKRSTGPTIVNVLGVCGVRVLWVLLIFPFSHTIGWLYLCYPASYICSAIGLGLMYRSTLKKLLSSPEAVPDSV